MRGDTENVVRNFTNATRTVREEVTEPKRSVEVCFRSAMETGKVGTRNATIIDGETKTCRVRHEGTTEKLKEVTGTQKIKETKEETNEREGTTEKLTETEKQELKKLKETREMKTETRESEEVEDEVNKVIDEHTHTHRVSEGQWG